MEVSSGRSKRVDGPGVTERARSQSVSDEPEAPSTLRAGRYEVVRTARGQSVTIIKQSSLGVDASIRDRGFTAEQKVRLMDKIIRILGSSSSRPMSGWT